METSGQLFKQSLDKAFSQPGITLNASTMADANKYKKSFKENDDEDIQYMTPITKKQLMKGTKVDQKQKEGTVETTEYARTLKNARRQGVDLRFPKSVVKNIPQRFRNYTRKNTNEGLHDTSWENNEGDKITLIDLLNATEDIPVRNISVEELKPHLLSWNGDEEEVKKIESSDLQYPILIFVNDNGGFITLIDGHHRAQKAARRGLETIKAKVIPINSLPKNIRKVFGYIGKQEQDKSELDEKWSEKYKKSIDCSNPKGFSQKAHCDGKKKETQEATGTGSSGAYSGPLFSGEEAVLEKSESKESSTGRKSPIGFSDEYIEKSNAEKKGVNEDLGRWFKEKWVDVSKKVDGKHPPCGRKDADGKSYPKCRPSKKVSKETPKVASSYDKDEKKKMTQQKRRAEKKDPKVGKGNAPTMTRFDKGKTKSVKEQVEKIEAIEATTSGSSGGYETPAMWAKSTKKKDWGPSRKTQFPGGGFVKIKKKCTKFPYCNQGDISNLKITKNESVKESIKNVSRKTGISENTIITILEYEYEKINKRIK